MCNWINIKWNECGLVIVIVMNDLEITSISMVAQWGVECGVWECGVWSVGCESVVCGSVGCGV